MLARIAGCFGAFFMVAACAQQVADTDLMSSIPVGYSVSAERAGPITAETQYAPTAIRQLFPEGDLETVRTADETGVIHAMTVFEEGLQVFQIVPDEAGTAIHTVHGSGMSIAGPGGERIGTRFGEAGMRRDDCTVGTGAWAGMAVCRHPQASNVRLVFDNGGWEGSDSQLAPFGYLANGRLHRIVWEPPRT